MLMDLDTEFGCGYEYGCECQVNGCVEGVGEA